jgi:hypothetical protein
MCTCKHTGLGLTTYSYVLIIWVIVVFMYVSFDMWIAELFFRFI